MNFKLFIDTLFLIISDRKISNYMIYKNLERGKNSTAGFHLPPLILLQLNYESYCWRFTPHCPIVPISISFLYIYAFFMYVFIHRFIMWRYKVIYMKIHLKTVLSECLIENIFFLMMPNTIKLSCFYQQCWYGQYLLAREKIESQEHFWD